MLETLVTSKTRLKLLVKFFLNTTTRAWLRSLEAEFGESTNGIRMELNRFEEAGMLVSRFERNRKVYTANPAHPLFSDIHSILLKYTGIDRVVDNILRQLGGLEQAWLIGDFAMGRDSQVIDLLLIGEGIHLDILHGYIEKVEGLINRRIRFQIRQAGEVAGFDEEFPERFLLFNDKSETPRNPKED